MDAMSFYITLDVDKNIDNWIHENQNVFQT